MLCVSNVQSIFVFLTSFLSLFCVGVLSHVLSGVLIALVGYCEQLVFVLVFSCVRKLNPFILSLVVDLWNDMNAVVQHGCVVSSHAPNRLPKRSTAMRTTRKTCFCSTTA